MIGSKLHVIFWPHAKGLESRLGWIESAFPRNSCIWEENWDNFAAKVGAVGGADVGFGAVIIVNGSAIPSPDLRVLSNDLQSFRWTLLVIIGDEGSGFHLEWLDQPKISIWVYDGKPNKHDRFHRLPAGAIKEVIDYLPQFNKERKEKPLDWFWSGSLRDIRWNNAIQSLPKDNGFFYPYHLSYEDYTRHLALSKIVPCRPSFSSPETSRLYDALEAGCVPIVGTYPVESVCNQCKMQTDHPHVHQWWWEYNYDWPRYWEYILGKTPPFPIIKEPEQLSSAFQTALQQWPENAQRISEWWTKYKTRLVTALQEDAYKCQQKYY